MGGVRLRRGLGASAGGLGGLSLFPPELGFFPWPELEALLGGQSERGGLALAGVSLFTEDLLRLLGPLGLKGPADFPSQVEDL